MTQGFCSPLYRVVLPFSMSIVYCSKFHENESILQLLPFQLSESDMASRRAVYVNQHEFAVSHPGDDFAGLLGSEDATTCHIVVLRWEL